MEASAGWSADSYAWDPYRMVAVSQDSSAAQLHQSALAAGTQPETLVPPVLPGPALPSAAASRANRAMCKVEGCQRLLRDEKPYYQRFLVCEEHMRCLSLDINGQLSRFCQQCGKFEPVEAFDANKRSCRARLQEHNKRRRKMGVSSRSLRKHRRNAAAANKAAKAAAAAAAAAMEAGPVDAAEAGPHADAASDAEAGGSDAEVPEGALAGAPAPTSSSNTRLPCSRGSSSAPAQPGAGSAEATGAAGGAQQGLQTQPPAGGDAAAAAAAADAAAAAAAEVEAENGTLLLAAPAGGCWAADHGWSSGLLSDLHPVQEEQQPLATPKASQRQEQRLAAPGVEASQQPPAVPASPTISDIFNEDSIMADAAGLPASEAAQPAGMALPPSMLYESSLLFQPAAIAPKQVGAQPAAAAAGGAAGGGSPGQMQQLLSSAHDFNTPAQPAQATPAKPRQHGSSCSSSGLGESRAAAASGTAAAATSSGVGATAAAMFTEEDRRLLDQLLVESADLIGTALQPGGAAASGAVRPAGRPKRYRGMHQQHEPLTSAACVEHARPLPSIAVEVAACLPPIEHRDDSAEDHRMCSHSSSDSGGSSSKRLKQPSGTPHRRSTSSRHGAQVSHSIQLLQQQAQHQQLQALQQQLQHRMLAAPCAQQQLMPQPLFEQQLMLRGMAGMGPAPSTAAAAAAAAAVAAINPDAQRDLFFDQQLQELMQRAGLAQQQQQQQQQVSMAALQPPTSAAAAASSYADMQAAQEAWRMAAAQDSSLGASQAQLQLQLQQQQQLAMAQHVGAAAYGAAAAQAGPSVGSYGAAGMRPVGAWGDAAALGSSYWQAPNSSLALQQQQQHHQQPWMQDVLAVAQGGGANAAYLPVDTPLRMSIKLHGAEPSQLQPELLPRLNSLLDGSSNSMQAGTLPAMQVECGYMRPGCVHLVLQLRSAADVAAAAAALAAAGEGVDPSSWGWALVNSSSSSSRSGSGSGSSSGGSSLDSSTAGQLQQQGLSITVQLGNSSVLVVRGGQPDPAAGALLQQLLQRQQGLPAGLNNSADGSKQQPLPQLQALLPCCISSRSAAANGRCQLLLVGSNLGAAGSAAAPMPLARCQGMFLAAAAVPAAPMQAALALQLLQHARKSSPATADGSSCMAVAIEGLQPYGLVHVELMQGLLLSEAQPLLVVDDDAVAAEVQVLQGAVLAGGQRKAAAEQVLVDFGRLLDFRAAAERHAASSCQPAAAAGSSREQQQQQQPAEGDRRLSTSAPLPTLLLETAADSDAPHSAGDLASQVSPAASPAACSSRMASPAGPAAAPAAAPRQQRAGTSRGLSRESSSSSLRGSLRSFFGGSGAAGSSSIGRRSFALETLVRRPSQQQLAQQGEDADEREASVSCFPTRRLRSSFSFSRRQSFTLDRVSQPGAGEAAPSPSSSQGRGTGGLGLPPGTVRIPSGSSTCSSNSGVVTEGLAAAAAARRRSFAVEARGRETSAHQAAAAGEAGGARRRSFGDFALSRSRSFRALTRSFGCGVPAVEEPLPDAAAAAAAPTQQHGVAGRCCSDVGTRAQLQEQQALAASSSDPADDEPVEYDVASEEGDSVSSFPGSSSAGNAAASVHEHPLLTTDYKALMMDIGVRLLCYFLDRGWAASARMVLTTLLTHAAPVASFRGVASAVAACHGEQLGLLHRAVRSGRLEAVTEVLGWAVQHQTCLAWDAKGPRGLTPVHLLALSGCKSAPAPNMPGVVLQPSLAAMVLQTSPGLCTLWFNTYDDAGKTPAWYASAAGGDSVNQLASGSIMLRERASTHSTVWPAVAAMPSRTSAVMQTLPSALTVCPVVAAPVVAGAVAAGGLLQPPAADAAPAWHNTAPISTAAPGPIEAVPQPALLPQAASSTQAPVPPAAAEDKAAWEAAAAAADAPCLQAAGVPEAPLTGSSSSATVQQQGVDEPGTVVSGEGSVACAQHVAAPAAGTGLQATDGAALGLNQAGSSSSLCAPADAEALPGQVQLAEDQPAAAVVSLARLMSTCQQALLAHPEPWRHLLALQGLRILCVVLLLEAVLHGSTCLLLVAVCALAATALLLQLLQVMAQPLLSHNITDAVELQAQLQMLLRSAFTQLPQPHSAWLLTFDNPCLEEQYQQMLSELRQPLDAVISATLKGLISAVPVLRNLRGHHRLLQLLAAPHRQWSIPTMHLLAAAAAAGLPLVAALTNSAHSMRDSVLAVTQGLLLVILRKPLLAAATAAAAAGGVVAGAADMPASGHLFHGCIAALLLLMFRQRVCWAVWQAAADAGLGVVLLCWEWYAAGALPAWQSLLHVLLPVLVLPFLYVREKVDRHMALASLQKQQSNKLKDI